MSHLRNTLTRVEKIKGLIRSLNEDYDHTGLPRGRSFNKKLSNFNQELDRLQGKLNNYGQGKLSHIELYDLQSGKNFNIKLTIPENEISLYLQYFHPGLSIISIKHIPLGKLG